jgi:para-aminobenzoate synthetase/4-amino-4-deoxychorismate lyase
MIVPPRAQARAVFAKTAAGLNRPPRRPFVLLEDSLSPDGLCRLFRNPARVIRCDDPAAVAASVAAMEAALREGYYLAGFFAYELGYLVEPRLAALLPAARGQPLLWFGVFPDCETLPSAALPLPSAVEASLALHPALDREAYLSAFRRVKSYIAAGDVYQVNLTFRCGFRCPSDPLALYGALRRRQRVRHGALIAAEDFHVLSFSPELFLTCRDGVAEMRPMKGTMARGRTPEEDAGHADFLRRDAKSRAENLMILDLMRNDLGRIAETGSVSVTDMFTVETYRTLHQMTSGVRARLAPGIGVGDLLRAVFPCGSVTGAPKIRAMEIVRELEDGPRGVYTGAIGAFGPDGSVDLNVAIRTLFIGADGAGEMGIGSGIVYDSDGSAEYEECLLKAAFTGADEAPFQLIETLRWERGEGYWLLEEHLQRLAASAAYFGYPCDAASVRAALAAAAEGFAAPLQRVRLTLDETGHAAVAAVPMAALRPDAVLRFAIAEERTSSADRFLYHKTTRRQLYDRTRERLAAETGCDEVLFRNERGELTEGSFTNLFVERDGRLLTPPLHCGLLNGTLRRRLLAETAEEAVLFPEDLATGRVYLGNSVRGLVHAEIVPNPDFSRPREPALRAE